MKTANHFFTDHPFLATLDDYEMVIQDAISRWSNRHPEIVSIYQIGEIKAPGVSDIDLVVVFSDLARDVDLKQFSPSYAFSEEQRRFVTHDPYFCTESTFASLPDCLPIFTTIHRFGKILQFEERTELERRGIALINLVCYLSVKMPLDIVSILESDKCSTRTLLCMLNSVKYLVEMARQSGITLNQTEEDLSLIETIQSLRSIRHTNEAYFANLEECAKATIRRLGSWTQEVGSQIPKLLGDSHSHKIVQTTIAGIDLEYIDSWEIETAINRLRRTASESGRQAWSLPWQYSLILDRMGSASDEFRKYFARCGFTCDLGLPASDLDSGIKRYCRSSESYYKSMRRLGFRYSKYISLGFHTRDPILQRIQNRIRSILKAR